MDPSSWEFAGQVTFGIVHPIRIAGRSVRVVDPYLSRSDDHVDRHIGLCDRAGDQWRNDLGGLGVFTLITLLMIGGNIVDNIIIAKHVRDKNVPWSSILWAFAAGIVVSLFFTPIAGMIASPVGLYLAEWRRLKDKQTALANTKAWMTGWGWSLAARFGIGVIMIVFWGLWAWL